MGWNVVKPCLVEPNPVEANKVEIMKSVRRFSSKCGCCGVSIIRMAKSRCRPRYNACRNPEKIAECPYCESDMTCRRANSKYCGKKRHRPFKWSRTVGRVLSCLRGRHITGSEMPDGIMGCGTTRAERVPPSEAQCLCGAARKQGTKRAGFGVWEQDFMTR